MTQSTDPTTGPGGAKGPRRAPRTKRKKAEHKKYRLGFRFNPEDYSKINIEVSDPETGKVLKTLKSTQLNKDGTAECFMKKAGKYKVKLVVNGVEQAAGEVETLEEE
jgi:hypothetical protein